MDEISKSELRNYASAGGFLVILISAVLFALLAFNEGSTGVGMVTLLSGLALLIFATVLVIVGKRDLTAILFYMIGAVKLIDFIVSPSGAIYNAIALGLFFFIVTLLILCTRDNKKIALALIPLILGILLILQGMLPVWVIIALNLLVGVIALYYAFALAFERVSLPLSATLSEDEKTDFKSAGSVVGFLLFAMPLALYAFESILVYIYPDMTLLSGNVDYICGFMLILIGVLMAAVAKMRFTSIMFILLGIFAIAGFFLTGTGIMNLCVAIGYLVLALIAFFRKENRILVGIMLVLYSVTYFLIIAGVSSSTTTGMVCYLVLNLLPALIAFYLAFAVVSGKQKLLKL